MERTWQTETSVKLPMDEQDKAILMELVSYIAPLKQELAMRWRESFTNSTARPATMAEEVVAEISEETV